MGIFADVDDYLETFTDQRTASTWFLWRSVWFCLGVCYAYLLFVLLGSWIMAKRRAFSLKQALVVYNSIQIVVNGYYVNKTLNLILLPNEYKLWCQPMMHNRMDEFGMELYHVAFCFYASKILDLMDTVFLVLRKKRNQVTFMNVSYQTALVIFSWIAFRFYPGGTVVVASMFNGTVNGILHTYYLMCALDLFGVRGLKSTIRNMLLLQLVLIVPHLALSTVFGGCDSPVIFNSTIVVFNIVFFVLFIDWISKTNRHEGHQGFVKKVM